MPLFVKRKNTRSPSPEHANGTRSSPSSTGKASTSTPWLRSRGGATAARASPSLPMHNAPPPHAVMKTRNDFLLGGTYYPGKEKRRRRRRPPGQYDSQWNPRTIRTAMVVVIGFVLLVQYSYRARGGSESSLRGKTRTAWFRKQNFTVAEERAEELSLARKKLGKEKRNQMLEKLAPEWYHRNDGQQRQATEPKEQEKADEVEGQGTDTAQKKADAKDADATRAEEKDTTTVKKQEDGQKLEPKETRKTSDQKIKIEREVKEPKRAVKASKAREKRGMSQQRKDMEEHGNVVATKKKPTPGNESDQGRTGRFLRTLQTMDAADYYGKSKCPASGVKGFQTTLVVQSSVDRLWILRETCRRWKDPMVVVVATREDDDDPATVIADWKTSCGQMHLIVHRLAKDEQTPEQYPVNVVRNLALDAVYTSHVLVVDVDFVPSQDLEKTIHSVKEENTIRAALQQDVSKEGQVAVKEAIVVPAFQRVLTPPCTSDSECAQHLQKNSSFIPKGFEDLQRCVNDKDCMVFQADNNLPGHSSTQSKRWLQKEWYEKDDGNSRTIRRIPCFDSLRYEPYVVIPWCPVQPQEEPVVPASPYYDERFHGYGKNKIQHVSHLRMLGYRFAVLPEGFIVHNPHLESKVKETWNDVANSDLHRNMDVLYRDFLEELVSRYFEEKGNEIVQQCQR